MTNRKNDTKYHEILKQASIYVYHGENAQLPAGYKVIDRAENKENGFYAEAYSNGKDIIIAYRGTDPGINPDIMNDLVMAHSLLPSQCIYAVRFHDKVVRNNLNCDITVTGHSLGGSNAEITSAIRGTTAVTFNAYGVRDMFTSYTRLKEDNIINYVNEMDGVTMVNGHNHLGKIYSVPNAAAYTQNSAQYKLGCHEAESMGNLSERTQKTPAEIKEKSEKLHPNIIKFKDRYNKGLETFEKSVGLINKGIDKVMDTAYKVKNQVSECVGSYYVNGYKRGDGTIIEGYVRKCGAKHNN